MNFHTERSGWPGSSVASPRNPAAGGGLRPTASHPDDQFWDQLYGAKPHEAGGRTYSSS